MLKSMWTDTSKIVQQANKVGFNEVHLDDIMDLLMWHKDRLPNQYLTVTEKVGHSTAGGHVRG